MDRDVKKKTLVIHLDEEITKIYGLFRRKHPEITTSKGCVVALLKRWKESLSK